jgi:hypothetical protein
MTDSTPAFPNLAGVITLSDVKQKGTGSYAADYIPWAKVTQLLNQHANGWVPELLTNCDGGFIHAAPNGTGFLLIHFIHVDLAIETPGWPYAITDNRNNPIPLEKISARDIADSHRRGICSAAAAFFALGFELWAREEVAAASTESVEIQPETQLQQAPEVTITSAKPASKRTPKASNDANASAKPAVDSESLKKELVDTCVDLIQARLTRIDQVAWIADKATKWNLDASGSKLAQMSVDQLQTCIEELKAKPELKQ